MTARNPELSQSPDDPRRAVLIALRRIIRATDLGAKNLAREAGLTTSQFLVLQLLESEGTLSAGQIAKNLNFAKPTVTTILDSLEEQGWVTRRRGTEDLRSIVVALTAQGRRSLAAAPPPLQERFLVAFDNLAEWEQAFILAALQRVCDMLGATGIDAAPVLDVGKIARAPVRPER